MLTINLVSNASMNVYPQNKLAAFRTVLAGGVAAALDDVGNLPSNVNEGGAQTRWEVALTSISFPGAYANVNNGSFRLFKHGESSSSKSSKVVSIESGMYPSVDAIVTAMSLTSTKSGGPAITYTMNERNGKIEISLSDQKWAISFLTRDLSNILGFDTSNYVLTGRGPHRGDFAVDPQLYHSLLVYTDIVTPQLVGNTQAQLLIYDKAPHLASSNGFGTTHMHVAMEHLEFREVINKQMIDTILIELRTETGQLFPFIDSGRVSLSLLFRRK